MSFCNLEDQNEEFNNFMHKVNEIGSIVKKLGSKDTELQKIGTIEADRYLNEKDILYENICEDTVKLTIKNDRTVINKKALRDSADQNTMSQEAFMEEVSRDADQRYKDKLRRQERADTLKTQGTKAFRRGEYERAITLYAKAIEQVRDSPMLYNNRALSYIQLGFLDKAIDDLKKALQLNENSIKAGLLLVKAYFLKNDWTDFEVAVENVKERNQDKIDFIEEYVNELKCDKKRDTGE